MSCGGVAACLGMACVLRAVLSEVMEWEFGCKFRALDEVGFGVRSFCPALVSWEKSNSFAKFNRC